MNAQKPEPAVGEKKEEILSGTVKKFVGEEKENSKDNHSLPTHFLPSDENGLKEKLRILYAEFNAGNTALRH